MNVLGEVLGLASCHKQSGNAGTRMADQAMYHQGNKSVFAGGRLWTLLPPPALLKRERKEERKGEKFYIYSDVTHTHTNTHTHTRPEPGQPWKARGRNKADTDDGQKAKTAQGGRGTNGPPEPTYAAKRTWPKQSTHLKPHDTLRRGTRGELGTKWGTS